MALPAQGPGGGGGGFGSGGGGRCPFASMSTMTMGNGAVSTKAGATATAAADAAAAKPNKTAVLANNEAPKASAGIGMKTSLTVLSAISKMKKMQREGHDEKGRRDLISGPDRSYLRAEARKDAERLNAYLGGMGIAEIRDTEESAQNRRRLSKKKSIRALDAIVEKEKKNEAAQAGGKLGGKSISAKERYGPYPKSAPVPTNGSTKISSVVEAHALPWDIKNYGGPDDRDLGTPDEWFARHGEMVRRLSGRHPFNAEPKSLTTLIEAGFLTPGHLHFTRNHGHVPQLSWDDHTIEVSVLAAVADGRSSDNTGLVLTMDDLASDSVVKEIPITMCCIGNRRSEFNAIRRTIGFSWGTATAATSVFRGVPLRTALLRAGVSEREEDWAGCHVEFVGADNLPNKVGPGPFEEEWKKKVPYGTSVPLGKAMDPARDMMLAFEANGEPIPPDHGYPCRVIVPGSTAARSVKWVARINVLPHVSHNLYHHHDNKILPPHVIDLESKKQWWYKSEYIVHELNINSAIASPEHGEEVQVRDGKEDSIEFSGYAYSGGGRKVTRVEFSIDQGINWDLTELIRTEAPTPHGMHWCWIFWRTRVPARLLLNASEAWCRAWDESNNVQPMHVTWNLMGLGQNALHRIKVETTEDGVLTFKHAVSSTGGWMKEEGGLPESVGFGLLESKKEKHAIEEVAASAPVHQQENAKTFTMEEIKKHNTPEDVWIVVNNKVYDCTQYLELHPGGEPSILVYGGRGCTEDFVAVHSNDATRLLEQYYIGDVDPADIVTKTDASPSKEEGEEEDELNDDDPVLVAVSRSINSLEQLYGVSAGINPADATILADSWLKALANESSFAEALLGRWRLLVTMDNLLLEEGKANEHESRIMTSEDLNEQEYALRMSGIDSETISKYTAALHGAKINRKALSIMMDNNDPLARVLLSRLAITTELLIGLLDAAVCSLGHVKKARYSQSDLVSLGLIDGTFDDYMRIFNRCGVQPNHWVLFCDAFLWCLATHVNLSPLAKKELTNEKEGAFSSFISQQVCKRALDSIKEMKEQHHSRPIRALRRWYRQFTSTGEESSNLLGEVFYKSLFASHPHLLDYFVTSDMDVLAHHLHMAIEHMLDIDQSYGTMESPWHQSSAHIADVHKLNQIPTAAYNMYGGTLLNVMRPLFEREVKRRMNSSASADYAGSVDALEEALSILFVDVYGEISPSMIVQEKIISEAEEFLMEWSKELVLSEDEVNSRLLKMKLEVSANDACFYSQTYDEIQVGARVAHRNTTRCPARLSWQSLTVVDKRDLSTYEGLSEAIIEHLNAVNNKGGNLLYLFAPREIQAIGLRFWCPSFCCYAGYMNDGDDSVLGDRANVELTQHLIKHGLWQPPKAKERTAFDLLPVVIKIPGQKPFPVPTDGLRKEVKIEHPTCTAIAELGLRSPAYDIVSSMCLHIGGVNYPCCAFNRALSSSEVVANLCQHDGLVERWAKAMSMPEADRLLKKRVLLEMEAAVLHSFSSQGFTILDDESVESLKADHIRKEMKEGRDALGNNTQGAARFILGAKVWQVTEATDIASSAELGLAASLHPINDGSEDTSAVRNNAPVVLISFGSATGTGEQAASRLGRALHLLKPTVCSLNAVAGLGIMKTNRVTHFIAICSTFNRGEFPQNAKQFVESAIPSDALKGVKTAVLGLGSTDYPDFCAAGNALEGMLRKAGGRPCIPYTKVDGAKGSSEEGISAFLDLARHIILPNYLAAAIRGEHEESVLRNEIRFTSEPGDDGLSSETLHPFAWPDGDSLLCIENEELLSAGGNIDSRSTRRITFQLPAGVKYESGDHLSVLPLNSMSMVKRFVAIFKDELLGSTGSQQFVFETFDGAEKVNSQVTFDTPATLSDVLQARVDFTLHEGQITDLLKIAANALYGSGGTSPEHEEGDIEKVRMLESFIAKKNAASSLLEEFPTIINFLEEYSFLPLKLADVLALLQRQQARYYSISSSPLVQPLTVSISVGVVLVTTTEGVAVYGLCSNYLARLHPGTDRANVSVQKSTFRGPSDLSAPMLMVGPGTGLAPMMGFLQERVHNIAAGVVSDGKCHLFTGCRTRDDRIYANLIDEWGAKGILEHHLALSRSSNEPKAYVQDKMRQMGMSLCEFLLSDTACIYICGDAKVANGCYEACVDVLNTHGRMSRIRAINLIKKMRSEGRWQYDLWGSVSQFNEIKDKEEKAVGVAPSKWLKRK
ncbi:hypothetical protein ACHAXR_011933 [Thalassiosira sp. AJA248-18]